MPLIDTPLFLVTLDDGRQWLTDGISGMAAESAFKLLEFCTNLADCNSEATIRNGVLTLEDGTAINVQSLIDEAVK